MRGTTGRGGCCSTGGGIAREWNGPVGRKGVECLRESLAAGGRCDSLRGGWVNEVIPSRSLVSDRSPHSAVSKSRGGSR
jgi:hypothetical protein